MTMTAVRTGHRGWAVVRLARPWFWPLGWGGAYLGSVLATGTLVPPPRAWAGSVAALIVLGPLVWTAVLTVNDLYDLPTDRGNPRKANAPLVTGLLTPADLIRWHGGSVAAAVVVAAAIGGAFLLGTVIVLILGWLYSVPPVRLKGRPGLDVAVNALVVGVLGPLAGWALHRPVTGYPPVLALLGLLLAAALYLPTTVLDRAADRRAGYETSAVRWAPESCYRAGVALWAAATVIWLAVCHLGVLVVRDSWWLQTLTAPLLVRLYAAMARRPTIARMAVVLAAFAVPAGDFLLARVS
jgi:lycopene elongase/hydratase (dihydrobisanhydrobacterioruberin-forming)